MSVKTTAKVWEWSKAEGTTRMVLLAIADFTDDDGYAWPGIARLAKKCRVSERTVQRAIRELESIGELIVEIGEGRETRGGTTSRYQVVITGCQIDGGSARDPVTPVTRPGDSHGKNPVTPMSPKPSIEPSKNREREAKRFTPPTIEQCREYGREIEISKDESESFWRHHEQRDWKIPAGRNLIKMSNWKLAMQTWKKNAQRFAGGSPVDGKPERPKRSY